MCCRFEGSKGLYRIGAMRHVIGTGQILLHVRKELSGYRIGKDQVRDAEDMIWQDSPYKMPR